MFSLPTAFRFCFGCTCFWLHIFAPITTITSGRLLCLEFSNANKITCICRYFNPKLRCKLAYKVRECQDITISFALDWIFFCARSILALCCPLQHLFLKVYSVSYLCAVFSALKSSSSSKSAWHVAQRWHPFVCLQQLMKRHKNLFWPHQPIPIKQCCRFSQ